ncbi:MAG: sugar ABC transporter ATP-binding protein [Bacillota bacterium]|nr:sugar ABC transporter ATP-binding protein [Bacillota bacterium]
MDGALLRVRGLRKSFPGVQALGGVDLEVRAGTVHGLVGENGAGKSTLLKVLAGVLRPDAGEVDFAGRPLPFGSPRACQALGIRVIHQEFSLVPGLSVAENILLDHLPAHGLLLDGRRLRTLARETLERLGVDLPLEEPVARLSVAEQQLVEIARALSARARLLVMDEPTAALSEREIEALFGIVRRLQAEGVAVLFVSHRLEEVLSLADPVTVMRDGRVVATLPGSQAEADRLIALMVGRQLGEMFPEGERRPGPVVLEAEGLESRGRFAGVDLRLQQGEVLALAGLVGSGRSSVARALFGLVPLTAGRIRIDGREVHIASPRDAMRLGIAYVPEDRHREGLVLNLSVRENVAHAALALGGRWGRVDVRRERAAAEAAIRELAIRTSSSEARVEGLSGGNQQKVVLAKWLGIRPRLLLLDEPTRGIDVGAKREIYRLIHRLASEGVAILLISSDLPELLGLADRLLVLREGRPMGLLRREEATHERVLRLAMGGAA